MFKLSPYCFLIPEQKIIVQSFWYLFERLLTAFFFYKSNSLEEKVDKLLIFFFVLRYLYISLPKKTEWPNKDICIIYLNILNNMKYMQLIFI